MVFMDWPPRRPVRILAPSYVDPSRRHIRTVIFNNIFDSLRGMVDLDVTWMIFQPDRFEPRGGEKVVDMHDFGDAVSLLESAAPDCLLVTSTDDIVQHSLCAAARFLGITVFSVYVYPMAGDGRNTMPAHRSTAIALRRLASDSVATDSAGQGRPLRRGRFIMRKAGFLLATLRRTGAGAGSPLAAVARKLVSDVYGKSPSYNLLADYHLLPDDSWIPLLEGSGVKRDRILVTGNPYWEDFGALGDPRPPLPEPGAPARILIVTDSLLGHNYWTRTESESFIRRLVSGLSEDSSLDLSIKIHPASEDVEYYRGLLADRPGIRIYQPEKISSIIRGFDLAVSFGGTTAHTEVIASGTRLVLVDLGLGLPPMPLHEEGIASGLVSVCGSVDGIVAAVRGSLSMDVAISGDLDAKRRELFPPGSGASARIAGVISKIKK